MKILPKNLCKKLLVINGIGKCELRDCICRCWLCEYKRRCAPGAFEKCQLKSEEFVEISDAHAYYDDAVRGIEERIQNLLTAEDRVKIDGGLLYRREREILHCFYEAPGDLPSAVSTTNSYISRDISGVGYENIIENKTANEIWDLIVSKEVFSNQSTRLRNGDVVCIGNQNGKDELIELVDNPQYYVEQMHAVLEKNIAPPIEGQSVREVYSSKMLPVIEWCLVNIDQTDMMDYTLHENFRKIIKHITEVGTSAEISPSVCYKLAFPHYEGMLHSCRYVYSKFGHMKSVSQLNKGLDQVLGTKYSISFDIKNVYDNFLVTLWKIDNSGKVCMNEVIGKDTEGYRFITKDCTLFGSALLLGFISRNFESICLKPYDRGRCFEDFVEKELLDRHVTVLEKNFETPKGEIDFICSKSGKIFVIEAKDYSPWFDNSYIGSTTYLERVETISHKLENAPPRLQWIDANRTAIGLPLDQKMIGVVLTRFVEPHIKIPPKFQYIAVEQMNQLFGESKFQRFYESIKYRVKQEEFSIMKKLALKKEQADYEKFGLR